MDMAYVGLEFQIWNRQRNDHWSDIGQGGNTE